jgi:hypothetical protein
MTVCILTALSTKSKKPLRRTEAARCLQSCGRLWEYGEMKTTLDLPDELMREARVARSMRIRNSSTQWPSCSGRHGGGRTAMRQIAKDGQAVRRSNHHRGNRSGNKLGPRLAMVLIDTNILAYLLIHGEPRSACAAAIPIGAAKPK